MLLSRICAEKTAPHGSCSQPLCVWGLKDPFTRVAYDHWKTQVLRLLFITVAKLHLRGKNNVMRYGCGYHKENCIKGLQH